MSDWGRPDWDNDGYDRIERHHYAYEYDRMRQHKGRDEDDYDDLDYDDLDWDRDR